MTDLSQDQVEKRASIQKTATIWGGIVGVIAGLLALWLLGGQGAAIRFGGAAVIALAAGGLVFRTSFNSAAKSAKCTKCGAAFSRSRTDRVENLAGSEDKQEREEQPDKSVKVTSWTEERYDVTDTYTCAKCGDVTTNAYQTTRRRDETSVVEPYQPPELAPDPGKGAPGSGKGGQSSGGKGGQTEAAKGRSGRSRR